MTGKNYYWRSFIMKKQPFYRNTVAMLLRCFSIASMLVWITIFLRGLYLYATFGWSMGYKSTLGFIFVPFMILITEALHTKAVEYGNYLFQKKNAD